PPMNALAAHIDVAPATLKRMAKMPDVFEKEGRKGLTETFAPYLDAIDPNFWPKTKEDMFYFKICKNVADLYQEFFDKDGREVMAGWTKAHKREKGASPETYWTTMAFRLLRDDLNSFITSNKTKMGNNQFRKLRQMLGDNPPPYDNVDDIPQKLRAKPELWSAAVQLMRQRVSTIKDMKADISNRLLVPAMLLEFERRGYRVVEPSLLDSVSQRVSEALWGGMSPTDQIAANDFWHSPQVNITQRFQTAALTNSGYQEWPGLLPDATEIHKGVMLHPLLSDPALQDEGREMRHCIGSYGSNFFTKNYHFFSVRDASGKRLSSLTVQDFFDGQNRNIRHIQNKSVSNSSPSKEASEAAQKLIKAVNEEDVFPDWEGIDQARGEYKIRQVENAAGYDIRDAERRQAVLGIYWPCVRHSKQRGSGTYDGLVNALDVETIVSEFLDAFDFSKGGLVRTDRSRPSNQNNNDQPRAAMG
ncbi:MAG: hypothetical protein SVT56_12110, partial [Chloroflexota bacterium]|nr:hypothetical protein [Chloroflexota bacterium]